MSHGSRVSNVSQNHFNDTHEKPAEYITTAAGEVEDVDWQHFALYKSNNTTVYADDTLHIDITTGHIG